MYSIREAKADLHLKSFNKYKPSLVMKNRRLFDKILHKIIALCLLQMPDDDTVKKIILSETYLNLFNEVGILVDLQGEDVSDTCKQILGTVMDLYEKLPLNPYKNCKLETAGDVMAWLSAILILSYKQNDLTWSGKLGAKVLNEFKNINSII